MKRGGTGSKIILLVYGVLLKDQRAKNDRAAHGILLIIKVLNVDLAHTGVIVSGKGTERHNCVVCGAGEHDLEAPPVSPKICVG